MTKLLYPLYHLKSDKGWWLPGGYGYTQDIRQAGRFAVVELEGLNLDGVTLYLVSDE